MEQYQLSASEKQERMGNAVRKVEPVVPLSSPEVQVLFDKVQMSLIWDMRRQLVNNIALCQLCEATIQLNKVNAQIAKDGVTVNGEPNPLITAVAKLSTQVNSLTTKLRIQPVRDSREAQRKRNIEDAALAQAEAIETGGKVRSILG